MMQEELDKLKYDLEDDSPFTEKGKKQMLELRVKSYNMQRRKETLKSQFYLQRV